MHESFGGGGWGWGWGYKSPKMPWGSPPPPPPMTFERHRNYVTVVRMCKLEESTHHGLLTAHLRKCLPK